MNSARESGSGRCAPAAAALSTAGDDWVRRLSAMLRDSPARAGRCRVMAVEGRSGAGKTELAGRAAAEADCPLVHMDDVYPGWEGLEASVPLVRRWILEPLACGEDPRWRRYDWERGAPGPWQRTPVEELLIVEGCGSGGRELRPFLSLLAWVHAPDAVREARLDRRADAAGYAPYRSMWARQEDAFYAGHRPRENADVVVHNP
ncbi:nucleoside/nucleotide kinase family protein [Streptomonospora wellingtoniae]|uniref:Uridine kinase n=1 Tax=Streptomonospora wellingtoniae TaxID=3075544 RepID=A0ABU2KU77_9ACTN|nr:hypothetical protein [Streptomonospora sp. DSM 45055]MDT0302852.1 hypothetical protein [Streptomonospora sp. DSM 45055]